MEEEDSAGAGAGGGDGTHGGAGGGDGRGGARDGHAAALDDGAGRRNDGGAGDGRQRFRSARRRRSMFRSRATAVYIGADPLAPARGWNRCYSHGPVLKGLSGLGRGPEIQDPLAPVPTMGRC